MLQPPTPIPPHPPPSSLQPPPLTHSPSSPPPPFPPLLPPPFSPLLTFLLLVQHLLQRVYSGHLAKLAGTEKRNSFSIAMSTVD